MTLDKSKIVDWRSTGRREARRQLFRARVPFKCVGYRLPDGRRSNCGKTTIEPPKDAPAWFEDIWPEENRVLVKLEADHESKDWTNNDLEHINWKCPSCHKKDDASTEKGQAQVTSQLFPTKRKVMIEDE